MVTVEQLYKNFAILADAKDKAGEVNCHMRSEMSHHFVVVCKMWWVG